MWICTGSLTFLCSITHSLLFPCWEAHAKTATEAGHKERKPSATLARGRGVASLIFKSEDYVSLGGLVRRTFQQLILHINVIGLAQGDN